MPILKELIVWWARSRCKRAAGNEHEREEHWEPRSTKRAHLTRPPQEHMVGSLEEVAMDP